uniref:Aspartic proteinase-like protein 2 isoform X2 n=1 Tax=Cicer arietinum TaxID=3827 RepID=A0A1S3DWB6_CICAR|nr:aspartic proteinase-like protein 2 isoform X2 [Cicer arietinum]
METLRVHDRTRNSQILAAVNFPVQGKGNSVVGMYTTIVKLGSPPRDFTVMIDTGSDLLWVSCSSCDNCPQSSGLGFKLNFFDMVGSSTAASILCSDRLCPIGVQGAVVRCPPPTKQCGYTYGYVDNSTTSGVYVIDEMHYDMILGQSSHSGVNTSGTVFFGTHQDGGLTETSRAIDEIFGFGPGPLSVVSQLSARGTIPRAFSHCLKGDGNGGGILVLGAVVEPSIVYSPLVPSQQHYYLKLESVAVNGLPLSINPDAFASTKYADRGTTIDSGTALAYLVQAVYDPLIAAINTIVSQYSSPFILEGNPCYPDSTSVDIFPSVSFNFAGGASMDVKPTQYLVHNDLTDAAMWCIGFQKAEIGLQILGDLVLKDKIIVYDLDNQRIGWTNYNCSMPVNVNVTLNKDTKINPRERQSSSISSKLGILSKLLPVIIVAFFLCT